MAENGSGKTTALRFISAIFKGQIEKLLNYDFNYVEVKHNGKISVKINRTDLMNPYIRSLYAISENNIADSGELRKMLDSYMRKKDEQTFHMIMHKWMRHNNARFDDFFFNLRETKVKKETISLIDDIEKEKRDNVIFWPTYRRIEKRIGVVDKNNEDDYVAFGMNDITKKFKDIEESLTKDALDLSSNINKDLIVHALHGDNPPDDFFSSIQSRQNDIELMLERTQVTKEKKKLMDVILKDDFKKNTALASIIYHLTEGFIKLKKKDEKIETFIKVINKYLVDKEMVYDNRCVKIFCKDVVNQKALDLDCLSSGEKHIIGMLSTLYLSDAKNTIIIDEPEISLSTEWQQMLIEDIMNSGTVSQLICATHSPFIFENEYVKNLTNLVVTKVKK
jgi:predicted ATPase